MAVRVDELLDFRSRCQRLALEYETAVRDYHDLLVAAIAETGLSREQRMIFVEWLHELKLEKDE
jgi:hypothetical protein